jgi:1,4-alpha-glucan branching enzyme
VDCQDGEQSVLTYLRKDKHGKAVLVVVNFTPVPRWHYRVGVPEGGFWKELINSDAGQYGGSGVGNYGGVHAHDHWHHGRHHSISLTLPPLGMIILKAE